ncbi:hypothetical protein PQX77_015263 [Marasmius sp. AFHP31]|nr:hypothetical protein PQX77_015263 [Marasmius sp. AFHP31]
MKLKQEVVPTWDGDMDTVVRWIAKVNDLARYGKTVRKQLGSIVPRRLQGAAETWYFSLPKTTRLHLETDWKHLRHKMIKYYMNRKWLENIRRKGRSAHYRETGYARETPSKYFIQKVDLLNTGFNYDNSELMMEVMEGAPPSWSTILTTQAYDTAEELQDAIRYHETILMRLETEDTKTAISRDYNQKRSTFTTIS